MSVTTEEMAIKIAVTEFYPTIMEYGWSDSIGDAIETEFRGNNFDEMFPNLDMPEPGVYWLSGTFIHVINDDGERFEVDAPVWEKLEFVKDKGVVKFTNCPICNCIQSLATIEHPMGPTGYYCFRGCTKAEIRAKVEA